MDSRDMSAHSRRQFLAASGSLVTTGPFMSPDFGNGDIYTERLRQNLIEQGVRYLQNHGQEEDGSVSPHAGTGPTSLAVEGMLRCGLPPEDPAVINGISYILKSEHIHADGGIYAANKYRNYETCIAMEAISLANIGGRHDCFLENAEKCIRDNQWDEARDKEPNDLYYGGLGYGDEARPDLSHTTFMLDALKECGAEENDPALQKALRFISRCQNNESEHNNTKFANLNPDGGCYYTCCEVNSPGRGGHAKKEDRILPNGGLRSYGSMSYVGLKSMVYCGLKENDPRVKAVVSWVEKNYAVDCNPGMGTSGLYYYYHTFAKALHAFGHDTIKTPDGKKHNWREDLINELGRRQRTDGSWKNDNERWMEGDPNLYTAFALLALSYCHPKT